MVTLGLDGKAASNVRLAIESQDEIDRFKEAERKFLTRKFQAILI